ncbi:MAG: HAD family hydrolase [Elusimicrobia bacterium]|nr:HAD family hydrolase [Elusimicrobiota bacterium]
MDAILFDYGGTLDSDGVAWKNRFYPIYSKCGVKCPREKFECAFYDSDDNLHLRHELNGLGLAETVKLQVCDVLNFLGADQSLAEKISAIFIEESRRYLKLSAKVLDALKSRYKLGVVSNFYGNMESVLASEDMLDYFGAVADSRAVDAEKPSAEIFNFALNKLGVKAADVMMVGDSIKRDMRGAEILGMPHALLLGGRKEPPCCSKAIVLKNLAELLHAV